MPDQFQGFRPPLSNFTIIPDELFDHLLVDVNGNELKVLLYILRHCWGYKKSADAISISQFHRGIKKRSGKVVDRGVGLACSTINVALKSLAEKGIIDKIRHYREDGGNLPTVYAPKMREEKPVENEFERQPVPPYPEIGQGGIRNSDKGLIRNSDTQETIHTKDNLQQQSNLISTENCSSPEGNKKKLLLSKFKNFSDEKINEIMANYTEKEIAAAVSYVLERRQNARNTEGYFIDALKNGYKTSQTIEVEKGHLRREQRKKDELEKAKERQEKALHQKIRNDQIKRWIMNHPDRYEKIVDEEKTKLPEVFSSQLTSEKTRLSYAARIAKNRIYRDFIQNMDA